MILLDEIEVEKVAVRFWEGIDIEKISKHPKDGSEGLMIVLFDSLKQERIEHKIYSILEDTEIDIDEFITNIDNNYVTLYQTNGFTDELISVIKNKFITHHNWYNFTDYTKVSII